MASVFTRIIDGEIPGSFVWRDEHCVAILTIEPVRPGHTLVVPRLEIDHWIDLPSGLATHLVTVAQTIGRAQQRIFDPARIALLIAGLEVPHTHLHVIPIDSELDTHLSRAHPAAEADLAAHAEALRRGLSELGAPGVSR